jgi:hypothetical protein
MSEHVLLARGHQVERIPRSEWDAELSKMPKGIQSELGFMSEEHHQVRNFVVRELPRVGEPLSPDIIANSLALPVARVIALLEELEKHLTFLFRNPEGAVAWAYPVTVERTPHYATFSTGEEIHAA